MNKDTFIPIRVGLFDHLAEGKMDPCMFMAYMALHRQCNWDNGLWRGTAWKLMEYLAANWNLRAVQDALVRLEKAGYICRFITKGKRGQYYIAIDKFQPRFGALKGQRLNASKSESWKRLVWEPCTEECTENDSDGNTENNTDDGSETAPLPEVTRSLQTSQIIQTTQNAGGGLPANEPGNQGPIAWDYSMLTPAEFSEFVDKVNPKREDGTRGKWQPEGVNIKDSLNARDSESLVLSAAIRYTLANATGPVSFDEFSAVAEEAREGYSDKEKAPGSTSASA